MLFTDPEATLSSIYKLADSIREIHPDIQVDVNKDPDNPRAATLLVRDTGVDDGLNTNFNVVGSKLVSDLLISPEDGGEKMKLTSKSDQQELAGKIAFKAGFDFN